MPRDTHEQRNTAEQTVLFKTMDGAELIGQLYLPSHPAFAVVVLNGATGVPQRFYRHFARWLANERGLACLTYDYRDFGRSMSGSMRGSTAKLSDWAITDAQAARRAARKLVPDTPVWIIGHSLGTMLIPAQDDLADIARIIGVSSGLVHIQDHPPSYRWLAWLFWFGIGPAATALLGFLPGRALGFGEDLPSGVYWQWRRWCTSHGCFQSELGHDLPEFRPDKLNAPVQLFSLKDDVMTTPDCIQKLADLYKTAKHTTIDPTDHNLGQVGHLGLFAPDNKVLWPEILGS
ncbi:MAG: alpha/beta fold hydrolase [Paracoccaceae bacterium]